MGGDIPSSGDDSSTSVDRVRTWAESRVDNRTGGSVNSRSGAATDDWPAGFDELYGERFLPLVKLAALLTGSLAVAEEIVQDAFVFSRDALGWVDNPAAYLRTAVVNGSRSYHRRRMLARRRQADGLPVSVDPDLRELADVLALLPSRQRAVLVLRYYADLTELEIADVLRCRPGTVKSLSHRGLERLREMLEP